MECAQLLAKRKVYLHLTRKNASGKVHHEALLSIVLASGVVAPIKMPGGEVKHKGAGIFSLLNFATSSVNVNTPQHHAPPCFDSSHLRHYDVTQQLSDICIINLPLLLLLLRLH